MLYGLAFVAAFALFALFAWMSITDSVKRAEFYRGCYEECLDELEHRRECQAADSENTSRMWEELDRRRMEVKGLEHQLQDALDENEALRGRLTEYWSMSN